MQNMHKVVPGTAEFSVRRFCRSALVAALLSLSLTAILFAQQNNSTGKVVGITDGDTIKVLINNREEKIRLAEIDAPEKGQPYGSKAKQVLSDLAFSKTVTVRVITTDRYGRTVARVYVDDLDVNAAMVEEGAAWVYTAYSTDSLFPQLQALAQAEKRGLWGLSEYEQVPPWEWRRGRRSSVPTDTGLEKYNCDTKTYCREMTSCDEARWYLNECGLDFLDSDGDGIACESLCR